MMEIKSLSKEDAEYVAEIYNTWRKAGVVRVLVSESTFKAHLEHDLLIAGPWEWKIRNDVPYGDVRLYARDRSRVGTMSVSSLVLQ